MAKRLSETEFAFIRELIEKYHGPKNKMRVKIAERTGRSTSLLAYIERASTFAEYVKIRPEPKFHASAAAKAQVGQKPMFVVPTATPVKKSAPSNSQGAKSTVKAGKQPIESIPSRSTVDGDRLLETLRQNMTEAAVLTKSENEQRQKLIVSNYVLSNATKSMTLQLTALNRDQWIRFGLLLAIVIGGVALLTVK